MTRRMAELGDVARAGEELPDDTDVAWTGRTMKVPWFAEHMREVWSCTDGTSPATEPPPTRGLASVG